VIGIKGDERSLASLAGMKAQPLHFYDDKGAGLKPPANREIHPAEPTGWGRVGVPGTGGNASCCGTVYPTSGQVLGGEMDLAAVFSITCDGKLRAFFPLHL
jgi:hypothetical protein